MRREYTREEAYSEARKAVDMVLLINCVNYAICDLEITMKPTKHVKRQLAIISNRASMIAEHVYLKVMGGSSGVGPKMIEYADRMYMDINNSILLNDTEKYVNIIRACCTLIHDINGSLWEELQYEKAGFFDLIIKRLEALGIKEDTYTGVDAIVGKIVNDKQYIITD